MAGRRRVKTRTTSYKRRKNKRKQVSGMCVDGVEETGRRWRNVALVYMELEMIIACHVKLGHTSR